MNNDNINADKLLREKLKGFSVSPPPHIWNNVQGQMAALQKRRSLAIFSWISAAAVIVLAFLAGWYFNNNSNIDTPISVEQQIVKPKLEGEKETKKKENILNIAAEQNQLAQNKDNLLDKNKNNLSDKIENKKKSQKTYNLLIAENREIEEDKKVVSTALINERTKIRMIASLGFQFENKQPELSLAEMPIYRNEFLLSETDKFLIASNATSVKSNRETEPGWKMGVYVAPSYSSHVANHSENYSQNMSYCAESGSQNIGRGFSFQYKTSKKLRIESGIYYAQNGQKSANSLDVFALNTKSDFNVAAPNEIYGLASESTPVFSNVVRVSNGNLAMNSVAGIIAMKGTPEGVEVSSELDAYNSGFSNNLITDGKFSQVFDFIEIPLFLRYSILDSKFGVELMGGFNAGVVVGNNAYIDNSYGLQNIGKTEDISTVNLSGTVGVGLNYALGKHISVAVEPRLNYYFNSINKSPEVDFRPYRIGIYTGLYYEF